MPSAVHLTFCPEQECCCCVVRCLLFDFWLVAEERRALFRNEWNSLWSAHLRERRRKGNRGSVFGIMSECAESTTAPLRISPPHSPAPAPSSSTSPSAAKPTTIEGEPEVRARRGSSFSFSQWPLRFLKIEDDSASKAKPLQTAQSKSNSIAGEAQHHLRGEQLDQELQLEVEAEGIRQRAVLLANLLVALAGVSLAVLPFRVHADGLVKTCSSGLAIIFYAGLLWLARWRRDNGRLSAVFACLFFNTFLVWRVRTPPLSVVRSSSDQRLIGSSSRYLRTQGSTHLGVWSEEFAWLPMVPMVVFCLLGPRAGVASTVVVMLEAWLFFYISSSGTPATLCAVGDVCARALTFCC